MKPQLTNSQFKTFLLIYAAHADYLFSEKEEELIKADVSHKDYTDMMALYENSTDYGALKIIMAHENAYLNTTELRQQMYQKIVSLFKVDGDYSRLEQVFLTFLDKMLTSHE